jgi:osmotically-inducible protein OsmY
METDAAIRDNVIDELEFDPSLDAAGIRVAVDNSVVTLSGHVPNYAQRIAAERAATRVKGVRAVMMDTQVRLPIKHDDDEIAARVAKMLAWSVAVGEDVIAVVDNGWVTLSGVVPWYYQRAEAERIVRNLAGVTGVTNQIAAQPQVTPSDVRDRIAKAFQRYAHLDSSTIQVAVSGPSVTLSGKVRAWFERKIAEDTVWAVPGVREVHDNISIQLRITGGSDA